MIFYLHYYIKLRKKTGKARPQGRGRAADREGGQARGAPRGRGMAAATQFVGVKSDAPDAARKGGAGSPPAATRGGAGA